MIINTAPMKKIPISILALCTFFLLFNCKQIEPLELPSDYHFQMRTYPHGHINRTAYKSSLKQAIADRQEAAEKNNFIWEQMGPVTVGGRIIDLEYEPGSSSTFYVGTASGGIFKTTDAGNNWTPIFDDQATLSIGDMDISPLAPQTIVVGTGEANAGGGSLAYDGLGVYRTTNGGDDWDHLGLEDVGSIGKVLIDRSDNERIYVAAMGNLFGNNSERGLFRTKDGGNSWEHILSISDSTGVIDLAMHPTDTDTIYAASWQRIRRPSFRQYGGPTCNIYRSYDGGDNWEILNQGLPANNKGRIGIAISESNPNLLYAIYADSIGYFNGIYRSFDHGDSWTLAPGNSSYQSYGWWFGKIFISPQDPERVFTTGLNMHHTKNAGATWQEETGSTFHVDQHAVAFDPNNPNTIIIGNDGGLYYTYDNGDSWQKENKLPIMQFYRCEFDNQNPDRILGGTQDNGTKMRDPDSGQWSHIFGGDGFKPIVDYSDSDIIYCSSQNGYIGRSITGGNSFIKVSPATSPYNWNTPYLLDPVEPNIIYIGANTLFRSENRGDYWEEISDDLSDGPYFGNIRFGTISSIDISALNTSTIYAGTDDGNVWRTDDTGTNWTKIDEDLPKRWITSLYSSTHDENTVYLTTSGYRYDSYLPHVFKSSNKGEDWIDITSNLPESPCNDIIEDPYDPDKLYVATDVGVYISFDAGLSWSRLGGEMPILVITDLDLHKDSYQLLAASYGRSMYKLDLNTVTDIVNVPITKQKIKVSPNPASDQISVEIDNQKSGRLSAELLDLQGKTMAVIFDENISSGLQNISMDINKHNVAAGMYVLRLSTQDQVWTAKLSLMP